VNYKNFLGYDKGQDGTLVVNAGQSKIVRKIFGLFLAGYTCRRIATKLTGEKVPTPAGKKNWCASTVRRVLSNETYMGDKLLQKTYSVDFLHRKRLPNQGQVQQYYVEGDHEPIIPQETFRKVQEELERRKSRPATGMSLFSGQLFCPQCCTVYGRKIWHSTSPTARKVVWQCNGKYRYANSHPPKRWEALVHGERGDSKGEHTGSTPDGSSSGGRCSSPTLGEEAVREAFRQVLSRLNCSEVIANLRELIPLTENVQEERESVGGMEIKAFSARLEEEKKPEFSEELWCVMVDYVLVYQDYFAFVLTSGEKVAVKM
jgi:hypothetical protein